MMRTLSREACLAGGPVHIVTWPSSAAQLLIFWRPLGRTVCYSSKGKSAAYLIIGAMCRYRRALRGSSPNLVFKEETGVCERIQNPLVFPFIPKTIFPRPSSPRDGWRPQGLFREALPRKLYTPCPQRHASSSRLPIQRRFIEWKRQLMLLLRNLQYAKG